MATYQFKVQIQGIQKPPVWRQLVAASDITLDEFHHIIQAAFGWQNCHLHHFSLRAWGSKPVYKIPDEFDYEDDETEDSRIVKLSEIFTEPGQKFTYMYDFGDNWEHSIILEKIADEKIIRAMCVDGKGACPPEDCGGIPGYYNMVEILSDPKHPEYKETRKWLGMKKNQTWDVDAFDKSAANDRIQEFYLNA